MEHYSIQLGGCVLEIHAPGGQSRAFPGHAAPQRVDLTNSKFDDLGRGPDLFRRSWDFGGGPFSVPEGSLTIFVALKRAREPVRNLDDLRSAIVSRSAEFNESGGFSSSYDMPVEFRPATVAGHPGWYVRYKLSRPTRAVILDERHYLVVGANISGLAQHSKWRSKAESISMAFLDSLKLHRCASRDSSRDSEPPLASMRSARGMATTFRGPWRRVWREAVRLEAASCGKAGAIDLLETGSKQGPE